MLAPKLLAEPKPPDVCEVAETPDWSGALDAMEPKPDVEAALIWLWMWSGMGGTGFTVKWSMEFMLGLSPHSDGGREPPFVLVATVGNMVSVWSFVMVVCYGLWSRMDSYMCPRSDGWSNARPMMILFSVV